MIESRSFRVHGANESCEFPKKEMTPDQAIESFLIYEVGYGGVVTKLTATEVVIVTKVLACTDTTTFSGTEEEMALLHKFAELAVVLDPHQKDYNRPLFDAAINLIEKWSDGVPLLVAMGHGMTFGTVSVAMILGFMVPDEPPEVHKALVKANKKDALAAVLLALRGACTLREALEAGGITIEASESSS